MKKIMLVAGRIVAAAVLVLGVCLGAVGCDRVPASEGYRAFWDAVEQQGNISVDDLDDDYFGPLDIDVIAGKYDISFTFAYSTDNAFHMAFLDFYEDFSRPPHYSYYETYYKSGTTYRAYMDFDVFSYTTTDFRAEKEVADVESNLLPTDAIYEPLKRVSERALVKMCEWVDTIVSVETDYLYGIWDICPVL